MSVLSANSYIYCYSDSVNHTSSEYHLSELEVHYAQTKDLSSVYPYLKNYITQNEQLRANKFHFDEDRKTFILCHAFLRLIISKKLNIKPNEILFICDMHDKPGLKSNSLYFNITHTRDAFAVAIIKHHYVGIDLEKVNKNVDFTSIMETYYSKKECEYILESQSEARNKFFLLWTRKEALLKALGTGIITDLTQVEVSGEKNVINMKSFHNSFSYPIHNEHFIYSKKVLNYYLSIAIPQKAEIVLNQINKENIDSYLA